MDLKINQIFKEAIPPLNAEEYQNLRESLQREGCRDAILVWNGVIVDGHNRYEICKELGIPFKILERSFEREDEVISWIMFNQLSRRNLTDVERGRTALKMKGLMAAKARMNCVMGGGDKKSESAKSGLANLPDPILPLNTRKELAKIAGISEGTLAKIQKIDSEAPAPIRVAMGNTISIHKAMRLNSFLLLVPEGKRETEAQRLLNKAFMEKMKQIDREAKIAKTLCNIISAATINYEYLTPECVAIYLKRSPLSIERILRNIDYEIEALLKLKSMFLSRSRLVSTKKDE